MSTIIAYEATPISEIAAVASKVRKTFGTQVTKPLAWRLAQLRSLYWAMEDNTPLLLAACLKDLKKGTHESYMCEIDWVKNDILFIIKNLEGWMKDEKPQDIPLLNQLLRPRLRKEPLGAILVLGCWNFPIQLSIAPLVGAIAAGCTGVLKPSEVSPASAMAVTKVIRDALDPSAFAIVNGAIPETNALLDQKWDKIFYTGNTVVGTIIAKKAAETLTPVTLELGGLNPAIITANADPRLAARRLLWGKFLNAGQCCVSQNYILVHKDILPAFVQEMRVAMKEFYPDGAKKSPDFGRIVSLRHFNRIKKMLDDTKGRILIGGETDESELYIEPTVVLVESESDSMLVDESFGPLFPIIAVSSVEDAIRIINKTDTTPLGLYAFGSKVETDKLLSEVTSGGASINDAFFHASIGTLQFGGIGHSGQGAYRGKASFDTFTHKRPVTTTPSWFEGPLKVRYPPYAGKLARLQKGGNLKPDFDRAGNQIKGLSYWIAVLFTLGGSGVKSGVIRWATLFAFVTLARKYVDIKGGIPSLR